MTTIENNNNQEQTIKTLLDLFAKQDKVNHQQSQINEELIAVMQKITRDLFK